MRLKTLTSAVALSTALLSGAALADGHAKNAPVVFGEIDAGVIKQGGNDLDTEAFDASIGVKGTFVNGSFIAAYQIDAEFAAAADSGSGNNDIHVQNALVYLPTSLGGFLIAPRVESGQQNDIYKPVDVFQQNAADASTLWSQPDEASSVLAYVSPTFGNTKIVLANLTVDGAEANDEDSDALALRVVHSSGSLYLAGGIVEVSDKLVGEDYTRLAFGAGFTAGPVSIGLTIEDNDWETDASDNRVAALVVDAKLGGGWSTAVGLTDRDSETDSQDEEALLVIVRKQLADNIFAYAEAGEYEDDVTVDDNYSVGLNITF